MTQTKPMKVVSLVLEKSIELIQIVEVRLES